MPFIACFSGAWMYDAFIYTGPSPVNTPWLGLGQLWWSIRRQLKKKEKDEEEGFDGKVESEDFVNIGGEVGKNGEREEKGSGSGREEYEESVADTKDITWDTPKEDSKQHGDATCDEDRHSQHSCEAEAKSRREKEGKQPDDRERKDEKDVGMEASKDTGWDAGPASQKRRDNGGDGEREYRPITSSNEKAETMKDHKKGEDERSDSGCDADGQRG